MDYEKKYKEGVEWLRDWIYLATTGEMREQMEKHFPELKESEDERIRKWIIENIQETLDVDGFFEGQKTMAKIAIAWLEKQGEQKPTLPKWKYKKDNTHLLRDSLILNKYGCVAKSPSGAIVSDVWVLDYDELAKLPKEEIEKQGEQKPEGKTALEAAKEENVDNQNCVKPADKVEPKFHEGDWITNGDYTWKIVDVKPLYYILQSQEGNIVDDTISHVDEQFHSFTIGDAKDGDVLSYRDGQWIFIYKEKIDDSSFCYHALYSTIHQDLTINDAGFTLLGDAIIPATKEQRDTLFAKMKEAGYEWDAEKKELRKIEQKLAEWSEEDENAIQVLKDVVKHSNEINENIYTMPLKEKLYDWLKSLKERALPQPKQEWSKEDEYYRNIIMYCLNGECVGNADKENAVLWLKSLIPQNR